MVSGAGTNLKLGVDFLVAPLHFFGSASRPTVVVLVIAFMMVR